MVCVDPLAKTFVVQDYDLGATLVSGQAFRWRLQDESWVGVIGSRWVKLRQAGPSLVAETAEPVQDWTWLTNYLQLEVDLSAVLSTFPPEPAMHDAVTACRGLRLLRQDPWECLASFILSSTKQIVQIRQIISLLCSRYGAAVPVGTDQPPAHIFPTPGRLACLSEAELRACKMGFRAPFLLSTARSIAQGELDLSALGQMPLEAARAELLKLEGVGRKISDCVLLFAFGYQGAFPVDVWIMKFLRHHYFRRRRVSLRQLQEFAASHFGPYAGYAQQYLFHYARVQMARATLPNL